MVSLYCRLNGCCLLFVFYLFFPLSKIFRLMPWKCILVCKQTYDGEYKVSFIHNEYITMFDYYYFDYFSFNEFSMKNFLFLLKNFLVHFLFLLKIKNRKLFMKFWSFPSKKLSRWVSEWMNEWFGPFSYSILLYPSNIYTH